MSNADKATKASTVNRAPGREENSFDIVDLPFGIVIAAIVLATPLRGFDLPEAVSESLNRLSRWIGAGCMSERPTIDHRSSAQTSPRPQDILGALKQFSSQHESIWETIQLSYVFQQLRRIIGAEQNKRRRLQSRRNPKNCISNLQKEIRRC
jgi:hypothetical protein